MGDMFYLMVLCLEIKTSQGLFESTGELKRLRLGHESCPPHISSGLSWRVLLINASEATGPRMILLCNSTCWVVPIRAMSLEVHFLTVVSHEAAGPWSHSKIQEALYCSCLIYIIKGLGKISCLIYITDSCHCH